MTPKGKFLGKMYEGRFKSAKKNLENINNVPKYVLNEVNAIFSDVRKGENPEQLEKVNEIANNIRKKLSYGNTLRNYAGIKGKKPNKGGKRNKRQTKKLRRRKGKNTRKH